MTYPVQLLLSHFMKCVNEGMTADAAADQMEAMGLPFEDIQRAKVAYEEKINKIRKLSRPRAATLNELRDWYAGPSDSPEASWPLLRQHLLDKPWPEATVHSVDRASTKVVSLLGPPGERSFSVRGLVLGYVQSGKTANFTATIAKAADAGYKLFVVLGGIHNSLRQQTQDRLNDELVALRPDLWIPLTDGDSDAVQGHNPAALLADHTSQRVLVVIKKNPARLRAFIRWLRRAGPEVLSTSPTLVVDDEADQASLNTKAGEDRSTINRLIVEMLEQFPAVSYVGYTATPFGNVLADPSWPEGLYPRHFIVSLERPPDYFGAARLFGDPESEDVEDDGLDMIRHVEEEEVKCLRPPGRAAALTFQPEMTESLRTAIRWFLLAVAARFSRGHKDKHMSMLVHTTYRNVVHERLQAIVEAELYELRMRDPADLEAELELLWADEYPRVRAEDFGREALRWSDVSTFLPSALDAIATVVDNGLSQERLVYEKGEGSVQIAIGGATLSRGLTLEGLMVSYFLRNSSTYDTLLQMGRWFGYRHGYEELPRVWTTHELEASFQHLATVENEIREQIDDMERQRATPSDVGIRIRTHRSMAVTSRMKMRGAHEVRLSFSGDVVQTLRYHHDDAEWLANNTAAARQLLAAADDQVPVELVWGRHRLYRDIDAKLVLRFLDLYKVHEVHQDMQPEALSRFIRAQIESGGLLRWNVAVVSQKKATTTNGVWTGLLPGGEPVTLLRRARMKHTQDAADIKALMSKDHRALDFGFEAPPTVAQLRELAEARGGSAEVESATYTELVRECRSPIRDADAVGWNTDVRKGLQTPLLVLYPIDKDSKPSDQSSKVRVPLGALQHVVGLALVFPRTAKATAQSYITVGGLDEIIHDEPDLPEFDQ